MGGIVVVRLLVVQVEQIMKTRQQNPSFAGDQGRIRRCGRAEQSGFGPVLRPLAFGCFFLCQVIW
jgi:hypothetical protein